MMGAVCLVFEITECVDISLTGLLLCYLACKESADVLATSKSSIKTPSPPQPSLIFTPSPHFENKKVPTSCIPVQTCTTSLQKDCRSRQDFLSLATNTAYHQNLISRDSSAAVHNAADVLGRRDSLVMEAQYYCCYHCLLLQPTQTVRPVHKMQEHACMRERWG